MVPLVRAAISETAYEHFWCFAGGGYEEYAFFGGTVRESAVPDIEQVLRKIAAIRVDDGEFRDYPEGVFHLAHEDEAKDRVVWSFRNGEFKTAADTRA